jgi:hypothetical protein
MKTDFLPKPNLIGKAIKALIEKLGISKATEFWTSLGYGKEDYSLLRKKIFSRETIESLYRKIKKAEKK